MLLRSARDHESNRRNRKATKTKTEISKMVTQAIVKISELNDSVVRLIGFFQLICKASFILKLHLELHQLC